MNSAYIKAVGREAENRVVAYLRENLPSLAELIERRRQTGSKDKGDLAGLPGVVLEVKAERGFKIGTWIKELEAEMVNAGASMGAVIHKRRGTLNVGDWYVTMPMRLFVRLLAAFILEGK